MILETVGAIALCVAVSEDAPGSAVTVTFEVGANQCVTVRDTCVDVSQPDASYGNEVILAPDGCGSPPRDALLGFFGIYGTGSGQIPPGSRVVHATLRLYVESSGQNDIRLHRMRQPWSEMDTWNSLEGGVDVNDCEAIATPDAVVPAGSIGFIELDVTASLAAWEAGASNYGWVMPRCVVGSPDTTGFSSSEEPNAALRPRLEVTFQPSCPPDVTANGIVDIDDLLEIINSWGLCPQ